MKKLFTLLFFAGTFNSGFSQCNELFMSEYIEGSSFNKSIEIYNPTFLPVNLSTYVLRLYSNGSLTVSASVTLTGVLNPGDVYVVSHGSANAAILAETDLTSNTVCNFNGDDVLELVNGVTVIDRFGIVGTDPGTSWTISGDPSGALDNTLRRKASVQMGSTNWTGSGENEWIVYANDVVWYIGSHVHNTCGSTLSGNGISSGTCIDEATTFLANGIGGTGSYTIGWEYGDGTGPFIGASTSHIFASAGTYNITYAILDGAFNVYSETFAITIHNAPTACYSTNIADGCAPDILTYTNCTSGGANPLTYQWTFGNGNTSTATNPPAQTYNAGTFNANLIVVDNNGCNDTLYSIVTVNPAEDASFSYAQNSYCPTDANPTPNITGTPGGTFSCNGCVINTGTGEIDIAATTNGNYIVSYTTSGVCFATATFPLSIFSITPDATITPSGPYCSGDAPVVLTAATSGGIWSGTGITNSSTGAFDPSLVSGTVTITYTFGGACGSVDTEDFTVNTTPVVSIIPISPVCEGGTSFNFSATPLSGSWSGIGITDANNGTFDPVTAGIGCHTITYAVSGICPASSNYTMCVVANANVVISNPDTTICNDFFGFFLAANNGGAWSGTYVSDNTGGSGFFSSAAIPAGNYYAVYSIGGICPDADSILIQVGDSPTASFTFVNNGVTVNLTNTSVGGTTYLWEITENGVPTTNNGTNFIYTYNNPTQVLTVCLTVTSAFGCESVYCETITPNGLADDELSRIAIYPNPTNQIVRITNLDHLNVQEIIVTNLLGEQLIVQTYANKMSQVQIDLSALSIGTYFITVVTDQGKTTKKIIKN